MPSHGYRYIRPEKAWKKLRAAQDIGHIVYIYGATGFGKTELARRYLEKECQNFCYVSCLEGGFGAWEPDGLPHSPVAVVDDLHFLKEKAQREEVSALADNPEVWLILISRSVPPPWLMPLYLKKGFILIGEEDLRLDETGVQEYLAGYGISLEDGDAAQICQNNEGNACAVRHLARMLADGRPYTPKLVEENARIFREYLEHEVLARWDHALLDFLMKISVVDTFTVPLAEMITGDCRAGEMIERACAAGNFLFQKGEVCRLRPILRKTLMQRAQRQLGGRIKEYQYNAGLYYEIHGQLPEALAMYGQSGHTDRIRELLILNARRNPGNGCYYELRQYYLGLREEDIYGSTELMAGMSMLYSLLMRIEESEYWYRQLESRGRTAQKAQRREIFSSLTYLDIALPHRGSGDLLGIFKRLPSLIRDRGISLPEFSVTSNMPSLMNGGKDFCGWSRRDRELATTVGGLVEHALGRFGKGLVSTALGESSYEKGADTYEVLTLLSRGKVQAERGGMLEMEFVSVGLQVRLELFHGKEDMAAHILNSFEKKVEEEGAVQLLPNLQALRCRMALYSGDRELTAEWMEKAPDEDREFFIMNRYQYLTKVRCYLQSGEYLRAHMLLEKLLDYARAYSRTYIQMEAGLLAAVVKYRMDREDWRTDMDALLPQLCHYRFVRLASEEGAAVLPLLERGRREWSRGDVLDKGWFKQLLDETRKMALRYPMYLKNQAAQAPDFSEHALAVLRLQGKGLSVSEIASQLSLSVETVRYHNKQNYRKLGVSGKAEAVLAARNLKLL